MLLQQGRRINMVLSVIECSLTRRRRITSTWRRTIPPVVNSGGNILLYIRRDRRETPSSLPGVSVPIRETSDREWHGVEDEPRTRNLGTNNRSYDRALKLKSRLHSSRFELRRGLRRFRHERLDGARGTIPRRDATDRVRSSASIRRRTIGVTWKCRRHSGNGGSHLKRRTIYTIDVTKQVGKATASLCD